jgi:hypothetical protein
VAAYGLENIIHLAEESGRRIRRDAFVPLRGIDV